jgi:hypothetical protein
METLARDHGPMNAMDPLRPQDASIPQLVGDVFDAASAPDRARLIEPLLRPLGILSVVTVAGGIFAGLRLRGGWQELQVRVEDIQQVCASDVVALARHAEQISVDVFDNLLRALLASPELAGSAAGVLLLSAIVRRLVARRA